MSSGLAKVCLVCVWAEMLENRAHVTVSAIRIRCSFIGYLLWLILQGYVCSVKTILAYNSIFNNQKTGCILYFLSTDNTLFSLTNITLFFIQTSFYLVFDLNIKWGYLTLSFH